MHINWQHLLLKQFFVVSLFAGCIVISDVRKTTAQITPDGTLGSENSRVIEQSPNNNRIEGGAVRGGSLFHSFQEFNVGQGRRVEFAPISGIENIFTRVTGGNASNINGTLKVFGNANLFLLNPNGILFGPNATLDIPGSFVGTTANGFWFEDGVEFSATNPQSAPLLKVNLMPGLQFGANPRPIEIRDVNLLDVEPGVTRALVGGNVTLDGSGLRARGGRIELGGLAEAGKVNVANNNKLSLSFPATAKRSDVLLKNNSIVNVRYGNGGDIAINAHNFKLTEGSQLRAGVRENGTTTSQAGDIVVNATGETLLAGNNSSENGSLISNEVTNGQVGNAGNIFLTTNSLVANDGGQISTRVFGKGNAGNVNINATDLISFNGTSIRGKTENLDKYYSGVFSRVESNDNGTVGSGKAGDININTGKIFLDNGAVLSTSTVGQQGAGNIYIKSKEVRVNGESPSVEGFSGIYSSILTGGKGQAGSITIDGADNVYLTNGGTFRASSSGTGNAGNIYIKSKEVRIDGESSSARGFSGIYSRILSSSQGEAGSITIDDADNVYVTNGGTLEVSSYGNGNAGNITINARNNIIFKDISPSGKKAGVETDLYSSGAFSRIENSGTGKSGNIIINAGKLVIKDGAVLTTSTFGEQGAGNIDIKSTEVTVTGESPAGFSSGIYSRILKEGGGQGGSIIINNADKVNITNGGRLETSGIGNGNAGSIYINSKVVTVDGESPKKLFSRISSEILPEGTGEGGSITIDNADNVNIINGGRLLTNSKGSGNAGNITINARDTVTFKGISPSGEVAQLSQERDIYSSGIFNRVENSGTGKAGNIRINSRKLFVEDGAVLTTSTFGQQGAGNIYIESKEVTVAGFGNNPNGFSSGVYSRILKGGGGQGGSIIINNADKVNIRNGGRLETNSLGNGNAGDIKVNADSISLVEKGLIQATTESTDGGNISLKVRDVLFMRSGGRVSTTAGTIGAGGNGGKITITTPIILTIPLENSDISADAFSGRGGKVEITAQKIFWMEPLSRDELLREIGFPPLKPERLQTNDITAVSQVNPSLNGVLAVNSLNPDLNRGLTPLPGSFEDPSKRIDTSCSIDTRSNTNGVPSQFVNTGRGGLPPSPSDPLNSDAAISQLATINNQSTNPSTRVNLPTQNNSQPQKIVEAQGWTKLPNGRIKFVSQTSNATLQQNWQGSSGCNVR